MRTHVSSPFGRRPERTRGNAPDLGRAGSGRHRGSVLIIVLWIAFGLVSMALYFGHSMSYEFRASDQNEAGLEAEQAIAGAARYISYVLTNAVNPGEFPATNQYRFAAVPVGDAAFWLIGRGEPELTKDTPVYGLVDEASKLNLNTATIEMLEALPYMTPQLAAAIIDWRDSDEDVSADGAESETYQRFDPPYLCKNAKFETLEELFLVSGSDMEILYGEDANLNGVLDPNENDGTLTAPIDNRDGKLDPGILEYVTVYSREPNTRTNGTARIDVYATDPSELSTRLQELFGASRAQAIQSQLSRNTAGSTRSLIDFFYRSGMSVQEFGQVYPDVTATNATIEGLINVNTASAAVLACVPGIGLDNAASLVSYRRSKTDELASVAWVTQVLDQASALKAGPYITTRSYQFSADVVAVGHHGKGYRRQWLVFDTSEGEAKLIYRRDRARVGWALGAEPRQSWMSGKEYL